MYFIQWSSQLSTSSRKTQRIPSIQVIITKTKNTWGKATSDKMSPSTSRLRVCCTSFSEAHCRLVNSGLVYTALIFVTQWRSRHFNIQYFLQGMWDYVWIMRPTQWFTRCCGTICSQSNQESQGEPLSLSDKCTEFFYMRYTTHGINGFTSHPKDEASWLTDWSDWLSCSRTWV